MPRASARLHYDALEATPLLCNRCPADVEAWKRFTGCGQEGGKRAPCNSRVLAWVLCGSGSWARVAKCARQLHLFPLVLRSQGAPPSSPVLVWLSLREGSRCPVELDDPTEQHFLWSSKKRRRARLQGLEAVGIFTAGKPLLPNGENCEQPNKTY